MDNLLLSFPRSGNGWVRYILEYLTKQPTSMGTLADCQEGAIKTDTMGLAGVDTLKKCIAIKRHRADNNYDNWTKDNTNLVFLLRDWREANLRHLTFQQRKNEKEIRKCAEGYVHCLSFYDQFEGQKILINYEDLLLCPKMNITKIVDFLGLDKGEVFIDFMNNIKAHHWESCKLYTPGSTTFGAINKLKFHSKVARPGVVKLIDEIVKKDTYLYDKYLKRYE